MSLDELYTIFVKRRNNIQHLLRCNEGSIGLSKKHELQGALYEIDLFLKTIEYYTKNGPSDTTKPRLMVNPDEEPESLLSKMGGIFKKK